MSSSYSFTITDPKLRKYFDASSADTSLEDEIRLTRAFIHRAAAEANVQSIEPATAALMRLVRAQAAMGGSSDLAQLLTRAGEEVLRAKEAA